MKVKLGEIYNITSGGTPSKKCNEYYNGGNIKWVKTGDLKEKYLYDTDEYITKEGLQNSSAKLYEPDTVLIAMYGATIGATSILKSEACTNQACAAFGKNNVIIPEYLYYFFKSKRAKFMKDGVGGAQPNISAGYLKNVQIEAKPINEQKKIVDKLDSAAELIQLQKKQIKQCELLIKSRFVEMFGDPVLNDKGFKTIVGKDFFKLSNGKAVPETKRTLKGIPAWGGNGISWYTDQMLFEEDTLVVGRVGFQSGNVHLAKGPLWITDNAMYISDFYVKDYDLIFLCELMEYIDFTRYQDAGDLKKITQKPFMEMRFIFPPIELQNQFATFVHQIDKLKVVEQKRLEKLQLLFDSLMQKYFG